MSLHVFFPSFQKCKKDISTSSTISVQRSVRRDINIFNDNSAKVLEDISILDDNCAKVLEDISTSSTISVQKCKKISRHLQLHRLLDGSEQRLFYS
jgi:hypothetical protein